MYLPHESTVKNTSEEHIVRIEVYTFLKMRIYKKNFYFFYKWSYKQLYRKRTFY